MLDTQIPNHSNGSTGCNGNNCDTLEMCESVVNDLSVAVNNQTTDHYNPSVRILSVPKLSDGSCGFHLSRSKWDPYPWVSRVDSETPAEVAGLKVGDCVLEVNGEDVIGMRVVEVAILVKSKAENVILMLWSTGPDPSCKPESLCCGPMPLNLERLSASMNTILSALECPVCLDTIPPPAFQCLNGHLVCGTCKRRAERCPVCRDKYSTGRSLIAEQVYNSLTEAFNMHDPEYEGKLRERLFGTKCTKKPAIGADQPLKAPQSHTQKFLAKIMGKASSLDNLSSKKSTTLNETTNDSNMLKTKSLSLSTSDIFRQQDYPIAVVRCPSSANRLSSSLSNSRNNLSARRPLSCNTSFENVDGTIHENEISIPVPNINACHNERIYFCPCGDNCVNKMQNNCLTQHVIDVHKIPVITFGTSSAEIILPPKSPIDNSVLVLYFDRRNFWIKLLLIPCGDLFLSALMQGAEEECDKYLLEISICNVNSNQITRRELITRHAINSLQKKSWKDVATNKEGIHFTNESLKSTFGPSVEQLLTVRIKYVSDC